MEKERNYSFDILKIISILFVVLLHYNNFKMGGLLLISKNHSINYFIAHYSEALAIIACNLFVMISGYFLCMDDKIKVRKIIDIILELIFYGVVIYLVCTLIGLCSFSKHDIKQLLLTIDSRWFINIYILMYILHPFINKMINQLSKSQFRLLIFIFVFFFSFWESLPFSFINNTQFVMDMGYGIINFILLYLIGAYIRLIKDKNIKINRLWLFIIYLVSSFITCILSYKSGLVYNYNFIFNIISTVSLFLIFRKTNIKRGKFISKVSNASLAVYIIHENSFICSYIYKNIFKTPLFYNSKFLILHMFLTVIGIFVICTIVEFIRKFVFKYTIDRLLDKIKVINTKIVI